MHIYPLWLLHSPQIMYCLGSSCVFSVNHVETEVTQTYRKSRTESVHCDIINTRFAIHVFVRHERIYTPFKVPLPAHDKPTPFTVSTTENKSAVPTSDS